MADLYLLAPLDPDHEREANRLARLAADAAGIEPPGDPTRHVTLLAASTTGAVIDFDALVDGLNVLARRAAPVPVRAHGFGIFCGDEAETTSLHVPVVRSLELSLLHHRFVDAVRAAGCEVAAWTDPTHWTPHITLLRDGLDAERVGRAVSALSAHHHPSWAFVIDRVLVTGPRGSDGRWARSVLVGG